MEKEKVVTLIDAFKDFKEEKSIDRPVMMGVLKDVFLTQIAKTYGSADNFDVIINVDKGTCEIYQNFEIVETVENPNTEMTLDQVIADSGDDDYEIGDQYTKKLSLESFGRRGILNIRQNLQGRIMDIEKANVYKNRRMESGKNRRSNCHPPSMAFTICSSYLNQTKSRSSISTAGNSAKCRRQ